MPHPETPLPLRSDMLRLAAVPPIYFALFCILTWPLILKFPTHYFCDAGDGLQNAWNLWWVNKAVTELGQSPWSIVWIHHPYGTTLIGHTLNPFDGFLAIPLLRIVPLQQTFNLIVLFSFVAGGCTAFLLCRRESGSYLGSLAGGFIFTFSNYHFAHASGHLQLVALEWIPLFLLLWLRLMDRPTGATALAASLALFLVILCDYYYFFYCVLAGFLFIVWRGFRQRDILFWIKGGHRTPAVIFILCSLATSGFLAGSLLWANHRDPFEGAHEAWEFSMDLLAPFIPGGHWKFASLTQPLWSRFRGNIHENSVFLGYSVLVMLVWTWRRRCLSDGQTSIGFWFLLIFFFGSMSLGPRLTAAGWELPVVRLPYAFAGKLFPPLRLSGMPLRMMVMVFLAAGVIFSIGWNLMEEKFARGRIWLAVLTLLLLVEYLPSSPDAVQIAPPAYALWLRDSAPKPAGGKTRDALLDISDLPSVTLFRQTIHGLPMALGYIARYPKSVYGKDLEIYGMIERKDYRAIRDAFNVRYLALPRNEKILDAHPQFRLILDDAESRAALYDMRPES